MKDFDETREATRRKQPVPAENADASALGLASALGNQRMQRIAASPEAGRVGPAALSGAGGALARDSMEGALDEDTDRDEGPGEAGTEDPVALPAPEGAEEDPTVD